MIWRQRREGPPVVPAALPAPPPSPRPVDGGLGDSLRSRLALALHERWHGICTSERGKTECARMSGAFDDVAAIEPLILDLLNGVTT